MRALFLALIFAASAAYAQGGPPPPMANSQLSDPAAEARAIDLMKRLRCVQCEGQSIHDSDAPMAAAMRHEVRTRIKSGEDSKAIEQWLVARFGPSISFAPPAKGSGLLLWLLPLLLLGAALFAVRGRFTKKDPP